MCVLYQSMHKLFEDKIDMLNEKERTESEVALANAENRYIMLLNSGLYIYFFTATFVGVLRSALVMLR